MEFRIISEVVAGLLSKKCGKRVGGLKQIDTRFRIQNYCSVNSTNERLRWKQIGN